MNLRSLLRFGCVALASSACLVGPSDSSESGEVASDEGELTSLFGANDGCTNRTEVFFWTAGRDLGEVARYLTPNVACTHYYLTVSLVAADKTRFHAGVAGEIAKVHALGSNFHAVAEFNWTAWHDWVAANTANEDWHAAGIEFRNRMATAGFDVHPGNSDTWIVQEFPTSLITGTATVDKKIVRAHALAAAHGLYEGTGNLKMGITTRAQIGSHLAPGSDLVQKARRLALEEFLSDAPFWNGMWRYVRFWTEELYEDPQDVCVPGATVAESQAHLNDFLFHLPRLAELGSAQTFAARKFLRRSFMPLETAAWMNTGYGNNAIPADAWANFLALQVRATRAYRDTHAVPGSRIGFTWTPTPLDATQAAELDGIARRLAAAINDGYTKGPAFACDPSGNDTFCQCTVPGATFSETWGKNFNAW
jgi:hypothetical protein